MTTIFSVPVNLVKAIVEFPGDQHVQTLMRKRFFLTLTKTAKLTLSENVPDTRFGRTCAHSDNGWTGDKLGYETLKDCNKNGRESISA